MLSQEPGNGPDIAPQSQQCLTKLIGEPREKREGRSHWVCPYRIGHRHRQHAGQPSEPRVCELEPLPETQRTDDVGYTVGQVGLGIEGRTIRISQHLTHGLHLTENHVLQPVFAHAQVAQRGEREAAVRLPQVTLTEYHAHVRAQRGGVGADCAGGSAARAGVVGKNLADGVEIVEHDHGDPAVVVAEYIAVLLLPTRQGDVASRSEWKQVPHKRPAWRTTRWIWKTTLLNNFSLFYQLLFNRRWRRVFLPSNPRYTHNYMDMATWIVWQYHEKKESNWLNAKKESAIGQYITEKSKGQPRGPGGKFRGRLIHV